MQQANVIRNVAGTFLAIGLSVSIAGNGTGTMLIHGNDYWMGSYREHEDFCNFQTNSVMRRDIDNIYVRKGTTNIDKVSGELFGDMRDATKEEREGVEQYIKSISKNTGVNFCDIC